MILLSAWNMSDIYISAPTVSDVTFAFVFATSLEGLDQHLAMQNKQYFPTVHYSDLKGWTPEHQPTV